MRYFTLAAIAALVSGAVFTIAAQGLPGADSSVSAAPSEAPASAERLLLAVRGLSCGGCEQRIRQALRQDPNVKAVAVDIGGGTVAVEYLPGSVEPKALAERVTNLGYPARYLASGPGAAPAPASGRRPSSGCNGGCCSGTPQRIGE